jgi:heat-inducible transcriptional repressor
MEREELTSRQLALLFLLVEEHIATGRAVSSDLLVKKLGFNCSSATIRNEMVKLENLGLVEKAHSSSGRTPSDSAFKLYAAEVAERSTLDEGEKDSISRALGDIRTGLEGILNRTSEYLSDETHLMSLVMSPSESHGTIRSLDIIPISAQGVVLILVTSDGHVENEKINLEIDIRNIDLESIKYQINRLLLGRPIGEISNELLDNLFQTALSKNLYVESVKKPVIEFLTRLRDQHGSVVFSHGLKSLIENPEFAESRRLRAFLRARNEEDFIKEILTDLSEEKTKIKILIGHDNVHEELHELSLIFTNFSLSDTGRRGRVAVMGPTRMPYGRIIPLVEYIAEHLSKKLGGRILYSS